MKKLTIIHLSDLHWLDSRKTDINIVLGALFKDIKSEVEKLGCAPDLVVFSGDLVQSGDELPLFESAKTNFLYPLIEAAGIPSDRLVIAAGNHDISRSSVRSFRYIDVGLRETLNSADSVNEFIDNYDPSIDSSLSRIDNYYNFSGSVNNDFIRHNRFVETKIFSSEGCTIGVAVLNTAWRATGESENFDLRKLLVGERNVDIAISALAAADVKIAVLHHPLSWLAEFDEATVSSRLQSEFDAMLFGHTHTKEPQAKLTANGACILSQTGCLFSHESRKHFNGYQIIELDPDNETVSFNIRTWFDNPRRSFDKALDVAPDGTVTFSFNFQKKTEQNAFVSRFIREARPLIREAALTHFNIGEEQFPKLGVKEAFVCPPLRRRKETIEIPEVADGPSPQESEVTDSKGNEDIDLEQVLSGPGNYLIVGNRESGKTSLAHYISVLTAEGVSDRPRIPILIDYKVIQRINKYNISKACAAYYGFMKTGISLDDCLNSGDVLFIIDNFTGLRQRERTDLIDFIASCPDTRWILLSNSRNGSLDANDATADLLPGFSPIHIQQLPRRAIRELSKRWCHQTGADAQRTFDSVMQELKANGLPRTGYIVTLLLWSLYQEKKLERINEAVLITNIVDHLIGKTDFTKALLREFDATSKEITLQHISHFLDQKGDFATQDEVAEYLISFFRQKGLRHNATDVLELLVKCGVLTKFDGNIKFKYRCFQEYFFALYLNNNMQELENIIKEKSYVKYYREIDLLSGVKRQNKEIIDLLRLEIELITPKDIFNYDNDAFETIAASESSLPYPRQQISAIRKKRLTADQLDDLLDRTDKRMARRGEKTPTTGQIGPARTKPTEVDHALTEEVVTPDFFFRTIDLFGRVIRNSEFNDKQEKIDGTILYMGTQEKKFLYLVEVLSEIITTSKIEGEDEKPIIKLQSDEVEILKYIINSVFFIITSNEMSEIVASEKLSEIFETLIDMSECNVFIKLSCCFILIDLSDKNWGTRLLSIIDESKNSRFILDTILCKLWQTINTRIVADHERAMIELTLDQVERHLGTPRIRKGYIVDAVRKETRNTERRLDS